MRICASTPTCDDASADCPEDEQQFGVVPFSVNKACQIIRKFTSTRPWRCQHLVIPLIGRTRFAASRSGPRRSTEIRLTPPVTFVCVGNALGIPEVGPGTGSAAN